ncbi:hypothetical protein CEUSTIGMA_g2556.t1 [Chlamydomonas eustigma]|uniref:PPPDE domain-containing protein n=1 Tax=Chlamydomonas eustigma TaxID=1157962 RepID=A0A250WWW5_9CHLO|nr:hypothetical protein CEUSTIGMA_g2556.t1 [Chlamydomonas eustigma]|eukprot:GAX75112.1 hypothetical protein CEUSTIGMA_g2556.t1 [Chlamydomonas eustigma]
MGFEVTLNVYDVTNMESDQSNQLVVKINNVTHQLGIGGVFHGGLAVDGIEWSFGYCETGSGVYACTPTQNPMYKFRQAIDLGPTPMSKQELKTILIRLRGEWQGDTYELLTRNCCHFCEALALALECRAPPAWLNRLAHGADATLTFTNQTVQLAKDISTNVSTAATWLKDSVNRLMVAGPSRPPSSDGTASQGEGIESTSTWRESSVLGASPTGQRVGAVPVRHYAGASVSDPFFTRPGSYDLQAWGEDRLASSLSQQFGASAHSGHAGRSLPHCVQSVLLAEDSRRPLISSRTHTRISAPQSSRPHSKLNKGDHAPLFSRLGTRDPDLDVSPSNLISGPDLSPFSRPAVGIVETSKESVNACPASPFSRLGVRDAAAPKSAGVTSMQGAAFHDKSTIAAKPLPVVDMILLKSAAAAAASANAAAASRLTSLLNKSSPPSDASAPPPPPPAVSPNSPHLLDS